MIRSLFVDGRQRHDGIAPINIYLMRGIYALMLVVLGKDCWNHIASHAGPWEPNEAMAWSVWAAFAAMGLPGLFHTVRMIPVLLVEVVYKLLWLGMVAYPLWSAGKLDGSPAAGMAYGFAWVILPLVAIPWPYVIRTFVLGRRSTQPRETG